MKRETRIKQSLVRVKSNLKLGFFFLACASGSMFFGHIWLAKITGILFFLAFLGAGVEFWNTVRLKK